MHWKVRSPTRYTAAQVCNKRFFMNPVATESGVKNKGNRNACPNNPWHLKVRWPSHFICSYAQLLHSITNKQQCKKLLCNELRSLQKMWVGSHITWLQIDTLHCLWTEMEHKGKSMIYILWVAKRHVSRWSNVEQWRNQACSPYHCWVTLGWRHLSVSY